MIAIDTNVLLRYLLQDDKNQAALANKLIGKKLKILITDIVLTETIWTLGGKKYKLIKENLLMVIEHLFKEPNFTFESNQTVWIALEAYRSAQAIKVGTKKKEVAFADVLILEKSKYDCVRKGKTFDGLYTFDQSAQHINGIKKL